MRQLSLKVKCPFYGMRLPALIIQYPIYSMKHWTIDSWCPLPDMRHATTSARRRMHHVILNVIRSIPDTNVRHKIFDLTLLPVMYATARKSSNVSAMLQRLIRTLNYRGCRNRTIMISTGVQSRKWLQENLGYHRQKPSLGYSIHDHSSVLRFVSVPLFD